MRKAIGSLRKISNVMGPLEQDMLRAAILLDVYEFHTKCDNISLAPDIKKYEEEHIGMPVDYLKQHVEERIRMQLVSMFEAVDTGKDFPFSIKAAVSAIPNAGLGVFVTCSKALVPGTVVALYPGRVYLKHELLDENIVASLGNNDNYMLMLRKDGHLFDPRNLDGIPSNPFAVGHYINHCGSKRLPNVFQVPFDFPDDILSRKFPKHLRTYVPYAYANKPSVVTRMGNLGHFMKGIVMVVTRQIENGDELFLDYRFPVNPALPWPDWYEPAPASGSQL